MNILLIEDDAIETMKIHRVVAQLPASYNITEAKNGEEALNILNSGEICPDIILLDLNMPLMNGIEFLKILKNHPTIKYLPTIVLTTSENRADLLKCYSLGIAGYVVKPLNYSEYQSRITKLLNYWDVNELVKA